MTQRRTPNRIVPGWFTDKPNNSRLRRFGNVSHPRGSGDGTATIVWSNPDFYEWIVAPNPATNIDRDILKIGLLSTQGDDGTGDRASAFSGQSNATLSTSTHDLRPDDESGTLVFWIKNPNDFSHIFSKSNNSNQWYLQMWTRSSDNDIRIESRLDGTRNGVRTNSGVNLLDGEWHMIAVSSNGSTWKTWVDGTPTTPVTVIGSNVGSWWDDVDGVGGNATYFKISGDHQGNSTFEGQIDEFGIWSSELTDANITTLYATGRGGLFNVANSLSGLVHYFSLSQNHSGFGADRTENLKFTTIGAGVSDTQGIPIGAVTHQLVAGIFNNSGMLKILDIDENIIIRLDEAGIAFKKGGLISEASDGAISVIATGTDPDIILGTDNDPTALLIDDSARRFVLSVGVGLPKTKISATDSPYTVLSTDFFIISNTDSGNVKINLPASSGQDKRVLIVKHISSTNETEVNPSGSETIDTCENAILNIQYSSITLHNDEPITNWWIQ